MDNMDQCSSPLGEQFLSRGFLHISYFTMTTIKEQ